jgi:exodeoxyribonuclease VII small subunit
LIVSETIAGLSFEDALAELERIVKGLEAGQQKLEEAIACYERGTLLRRHCEAQLAAAEMRVQAIAEQADGRLVPADAEGRAGAGAAGVRPVPAEAGRSG